MKEKSKLFKTMGAGLNIQNQTKAHRGYIAKRYMKKVERIEMAEFEKSMVNLTPQMKNIPVRAGGEIIAYL